MADLLEFGTAPSALAELVTSDTLELFVAETGDEIRDYATCEPPETGTVARLSLYLHPEHSGEGLGTALFERARTDIADVGVTAVEDSVLAANLVGNAVYDKHCEQVRETTVEMGGETDEANVYRAGLRRGVRAPCRPSFVRIGTVERCWSSTPELRRRERDVRSTWTSSVPSGECLIRIPRPPSLRKPSARLWSG